MTERSFNEYFDLVTKVAQVIQGESGKPDSLSFSRAQDVVDKFNVTEKEAKT